ncbi:MAG: hypothetical protein AB7O44_29400 [Hyphomicrobiaceae bacterium]
MNLKDIFYGDLAGRERDERRRLHNRLVQLRRTALGRIDGRADGEDEDLYSSDDERREKAHIKRVLDVLEGGYGEWCDPLFIAVRDIFNDKPGLLSTRLANPEGDLDGEMPGVQLRVWSGTALNDQAATDCALTIGLLMINAAEPPPVRFDPRGLPKDAGERTEPDPKKAKGAKVAEGTSKDERTASSSGEGGDRHQFVLNADRDHSRWPLLNRAFFQALGEAQSMGALAVRVLGILAGEGQRRSGGRESPYVEMTEFAKVMRELVQRGTDENERQLPRRVTEALDRVQLVGQDDVTSEIGIDLPDLEGQADNEIVADNVRLMGPVICAAMLDELKAFQVVDWMLDSAQTGALPITGKGNAGRLLYKRWKSAPNRISETERRNLYAMTMGQPGGDPNGRVNREFNDLWLRFVSSVSAFVRQHDVDRLLRATVPSAIGHQQVRKAARDLSANLSLHGYGMTYYAALDLQSEVKSLIELLSDVEIKAAFGAKDMWQVIDHVATLELGGARTSSRYRTLATCGAIITAWLANNVQQIMRPTGPLIDIVEVRSPMPATAGQKATTNPKDYDLVNACELWLADTATSESRIEELSQPRESPVMTSKPVQLPGFARELMQDLPEMPGMSFGVNGRNGQRMRH